MEFVHPTGGRLFVGKAGALRAGDCASRSFSVGDPRHQNARYAAILADGDKALNPMEQYE